MAVLPFSRAAGARRGGVREDALSGAAISYVYYIYIYIYIYMLYIYIYIYICFIYIYICFIYIYALYIYIYVYVYVYIYIKHIFIERCICIYYLSLSLSIYIYIYTHTHPCIHTSLLRFALSHLHADTFPATRGSPLPAPEAPPPALSITQYWLARYIISSTYCKYYIINTIYLNII